MEQFLPLIEQYAPMFITFVIGLIIKSPIGVKGVEVLAEVGKALEDKKITKDELEAIIKAIK